MNQDYCQEDSATYDRCAHYNMLFVPPMKSWTRVLLPGAVNEWEKFLKSHLMDYISLNYLTLKRVINWCPNLNLLYPIYATGDGNCLMNAVSISITVGQDCSLMFRNLVYENMAHYVISEDIRLRWQRQRQCQNMNIPDGGLHFTEEEWDTEWKKVVQAAADTPRKISRYNIPVYEYLEAVHIFALANTLRRPIIVYAEPFMCGYRGNETEQIQQNDLVGIYMPLYVDYRSCNPVPVVLAFIVDHFLPLLTRGSETGLKDVVPLVTADLEPLRIHFLLPDEEGAIANILLQQYLVISEEQVKLGDSTEIVLCASLNHPQNMNLLSVVPDTVQFSPRGSHRQAAIGHSNQQHALDYQCDLDVSSSECKSSLRHTNAIYDDFEQDMCSCDCHQMMNRDSQLEENSSNKLKTMLYCRDSSLIKKPPSSKHNVCQHGPHRTYPATGYCESSDDRSLAVFSPSEQSSRPLRQNRSVWLISVYTPSTPSAKSPGNGGEMAQQSGHDQYADSSSDKEGTWTNFLAITSVDKASDHSSEAAGGRAELSELPALIDDIDTDPPSPTVHQTTDQLSTWQHTAGTGRCMGPSCSEHGVTQLRGLCFKCYRTLLNSNFAQKYPDTVTQLH